MNFVLAPSNAYWWPVTVRMPDPDNPGKLVGQEMRIRFEARDQEAEIAEQERIQSQATVAEQARAERDSLAAICRDWEGVVTPDGQPLPFNKANPAAALQQPWFRTAVFRAYHESLTGQEARLGN